MPRIIIRVADPRDGRDYYTEWSTVTDTPITAFYSRADFEKWYRDYYGHNADDLPERMARVDQTGVSAMYDLTVEDLILCNRAGKREGSLKLKGLLDKYRA